MDKLFLHLLNLDNNLKELIKKLKNNENKRSVLIIKMSKFIKTNKSNILSLIDIYNENKKLIKKLNLKNNTIRDFNKIQYILNNNNEIYIEYNIIKNEYDKINEKIYSIKKYIINKYEYEIIYGLCSLYNQYKNISYNSKKRKINK